MCTEQMHANMIASPHAQITNQTTFRLLCTSCGFQGASGIDGALCMAMEPSEVIGVHLMRVRPHDLPSSAGMKKHFF